MRNTKKTTAIVLAGGRGARMNSDIPKQYMEVCGYPIIYYSLKVFEESFVDEIVLVCGAGDEEYCKQNIVDKYDFAKVKKIVVGGKERYHSVLNGLSAIDECDIVFIHDGARPFVSKEILARAFEEALIYGNAIVAVPSKDTVKLADREQFAESTPNRDSVWIVQTPQTFVFEKIYKAYCELIDKENELHNKGVIITDDAMVMEQFGSDRIRLCAGDYKNIKVTTPEDIIVAKAYISNMSTE